MRNWIFWTAGVCFLVAGCSAPLPPTPTPPFSPLVVETVETNWPFTAFVTALATTADGRMWAGTYDQIGLFSRTRGSSWQPVSRPHGGPVYDMLVVDGRLLLATQHGVETPNGEVLWDGGAVYALSATPDGPCGASAQGLICEENASWRARAGPPVEDAPLLDLAVGGPWWLVGTGGAGAWQSRDGARSWEPLPVGDSEFVSVVEIVDNQVAFARTLKGLWRTTDGGRSWVSLPVPGRVLDVLWTGEHLLVALVGGHVLASEDLGDIWQALTASPLPHDVVVLGQTAEGRLLAGTRDGVYLFRDTAWVRASEGLGHQRFETLLVTEEQGQEVLLAGHLRGIYFSRDGGATWSQPETRMNRYTVLTLAASPWEDNRLFAGTFGAGIWQSRDGGRSWEPLENRLSRLIVPQVVPDPAQPGRLLARVAYERLYESVDGGLTWEARWDGFEPTVEVFALARVPHSGNMWFAGANDGLFRSTDNGRTWTRLANGLNGVSVFAVAPDPAASGRLWIGTTRGLYLSEDGGQTVQRVGLDAVTVTHITFTGDGTPLVGTAHEGIWWWGPDGWESVPEMAGRQVTAVVPGRSALYVATDDGLWRLRVKSAGFQPQLAPAGGQPSPTPSPRPVPRRQLRGFHLVHPSDMVFRRAAEAGAEVVVVVFPWREIEPNPDEFHWEHTDAWVNAARYYDLRLIVRLDQTPDWAGERMSARALNTPPRRLEDWADFVFQVARRYRGLVEGYIVWNEPNLAREWGGYPPDPAAYLALLRTAAQAIRVADPGARVVAAGLAMTNHRDQTAIDERLFLAELYRAGGRGIFDALAAHPYGFGLPPDAPRQSSEDLVFTRLEDLRAVMVQFGDTGTPVWVTEFGWTVRAHPEGQPPVSPAEQAAFLETAFAWLADRPWVKAATAWYLGQDIPPDDEKAGFNLLDPSGAPTMAWHRLQAFLGGPRETRGPSLPVALAADVPVHLGDSELPPPWWPLYRGRNPSVWWEGGFYLHELPAQAEIAFELMQLNEPGFQVFLNDVPLLVQPLPVADFSAAWRTYRVPVSPGLLKEGYNTVRVVVAQQHPDYQQREYVWDDVMVRHLRLMTSR